MKVLFLASWYPMRYDAMAGLFVRKHAQAVKQQGVDVHVLSVYGDSRVEQEELSVEEVEGVKEYILYIPDKVNSLSGIRALFKLWRIWHKENGVPDIVHLNVITKEGLLALWLKRKYGVPYVVTEHWSGYLPENGNYRGVVRKKMSEAIARNAAVIMPVSQKLKEAMQQCGLVHSKYQVVPNVVDDFFYEASPQLEPRTKRRILHVSCFENRSKNVYGIIEAAAQLYSQRKDFELIMVGIGGDFEQTKQLAAKYNLLDAGVVKFYGEMTPYQVKQEMDLSDLFLLFSNFENAPVVISEALACGLPIISSAVGFVPELVDDKVGVVVPVRDIDALVLAINNIIDGKNRFDCNYIKSKSEQFRFASVGGMFVEQYRSALK
ncbi:MAG: glycosyltransferase [bacterium]